MIKRNRIQIIRNIGIFIFRGIYEYFYILLNISGIAVLVSIFIFGETYGWNFQKFFTDVSFLTNEQLKEFLMLIFFPIFLILIVTRILLKNIIQKTRNIRIVDIYEELNDNLRNRLCKDNKYSECDS